MKKLLILSLIVIAAIAANAQPLVKGNLLGVHVMTIKLNPGYTMDQAIDFWVKKYIPVVDKEWGTKSYILKGIRGENKDKFGYLIVFKTEADRDKYFNKDGSSTDLKKKIDEKTKPIEDEFAKIGTFTTVYTDWIIQ
jgi:hypothetical protein